MPASSSYLSHCRGEMLDPFAHAHLGDYQTTLAALKFWNSVTKIEVLPGYEVLQHSAGNDFLSLSPAPFERPCAHDIGSLFAFAFNTGASKPVDLYDRYFFRNGGRLPIAFRVSIRHPHLPKDEIKLPRTFFAGSVMRCADAFNILLHHAQSQTPDMIGPALLALIKQRKNQEEKAQCVSISPFTDRPVVLLARGLPSHTDCAPLVTVALPTPGDVVLNSRGLPYYIYNGPTLVDDCIDDRNLSTCYTRPNHTFIEFVEGKLCATPVIGWPMYFCDGRVGSNEHLEVRRRAGLKTPSPVSFPSLLHHAL